MKHDNFYSLIGRIRKHLRREKILYKKMYTPQANQIYKPHRHLLSLEIFSLQKDYSYLHQDDTASQAAPINRNLAT